MHGLGRARGSYRGLSGWTSRSPATRSVPFLTTTRPRRPSRQRMCHPHRFLEPAVAGRAHRHGNSVYYKRSWTEPMKDRAAGRQRAPHQSGAGDKPAPGGRDRIHRGYPAGTPDRPVHDRGPDRPAGRLHDRPSRAAPGGARDPRTGRQRPVHRRRRVSGPIGTAVLASRAERLTVATTIAAVALEEPDRWPRRRTAGPRRGGQRARGGARTAG